MRKANRGFLNPNVGTACFEWVVAVEEDYPSIASNFEITDCSRKVCLDFYCYTTNDGRHSTYEERMHKIDLLISEMLKFKAAMVEAKVHMDTANIEYRKAKESKHE